MAAQAFLGAPEGPSHGNFTGLTRLGNQWLVSLVVDGVNYKLGTFGDRDHAALAYDMEALRAFGMSAPQLNFRYQLLEENSPSNNNILRLLDSRGVTFNVDVVSNESPSSYMPVSVAPVADKKALDGEFVSRQRCGVPPLPDATRSWEARNSTLYAPTASFVYEIKYPNSESLGLNLKQSSIHHSLESDQSIGILEVVDCMPLLSSLVYPGDIFLSINGTTMSNYGDKFNFDEMTDCITRTPLPRTVKFLRPSGPSHTLSAAEICLFMGMSADRGASNINHLIKPHAQCTPSSVAKFNVALSETGSTQSLQLLYLEKNAPLAMKRMMQGQKVNWEGNPAQKVIASDTKFTSAKTVTTSNERYHTPEIFQESVTTTTFTDGVIHKWIAQLVLSPRDNTGSADVSISVAHKDKEKSDDNDPKVKVKQEVMGGSDASTASMSDVKLSTSNDEDSSKRKRSNSSDVELVYRKKILANKLHDKVYFLGKFDYEADARAVLKIARQEAEDNGGIFYPHKITPPVRTASSMPSSGSHSTTAHALSNAGSTAATSAQHTTTKLSPSAALFNRAQTNPSTTSSPSSSSAPQASTSQPTSFHHKPAGPYRSNKTKVKQLAAIKAVAGAFQGNGPHSQSSMNLGFSTTKHYSVSSSSSSSSAPALPVFSPTPLPSSR